MIRHWLAERQWNSAKRLMAADEPERAARRYFALLADNPHRPGVWVNLGGCLLAQGNAWGALGCYRTAMQYDGAERWAAQFNAGIALLMLGQWADGWKLYEARFTEGTSFHKANALRARYAPETWWDGSLLAGRTILVFHEQGAGDVLMCLRYAWALAARGAGRVIFRVPGSLYRIVRSSFREFKRITVIADGERLPDYDCVVPFMSLPHHCGDYNRDAVLGRTGFCVTGPYLHVHRDDIRSRVGDRLNVGLVWAGNPQHKGDRKRSIPFPELAPLLDVPGLSFLSLQHGPRADDAPELPRVHPKPKDFYATACALQSLDLLITCDTSVAHLAGGLGVRTWLLLPFVPDFRWTLIGDTTPWYSSMKLYRQSRPKDWAGVITRVRNDLARLSDSHHAKDAA